MIPFAAFWTVALVSNIASAAQQTTVSWVLGDLELPASVLLVRQIVAAAGAIVGVMVGTTIIPRLGFRRCLVLSSLGEAMSALAVVVVLGTTSGPPSTGQAFAVATTGGAMAFAAAVGAPAWLALVADWPGTADRTRQLLIDSVQFQLGRSIGPLAGAVLLAATALPVQISSLVNAASFVLVALCLALRGRAPMTPEIAERPQRPSLRALVPSLRSPVVIALVIVAVCADAGRTFLPRIMQAAAADSATFSLAASVGAVAAAGTAYAASRVRWGRHVLAVTGMALLVAALACWAVAPLWWALWIVGSGLVGAAVSLCSSALVSALMDTRGNLHGVSVATLTRTVFSVGGGVLFTAVAGIAGAFTFAWFVPLAAVATVLLARTPAEFAAPVAAPTDDPPGGSTAGSTPSG